MPAVPEFLDFVMTEWPEHQTPIRGGLAWLDRESTRRFGKPFREAAGTEQTAILDDIAYPARAQPEMAQGVEFFNRFRDLVLSGFYSSKEGVKDLGYIGNTFVAEWKGCPCRGRRVQSKALIAAVNPSPVDSLRLERDHQSRARLELHDPCRRHAPAAPVVPAPEAAARPKPS